MQTENKMGIMPIGKLLANMAIPMIISMLFQSFYNIIDSVFVSRISENALTAVSLVFPLQNLCIAIGSGTGVGMNALLSRSLGEKKQDMVDRTANTGIFLYVCSYAAFVLLGLFALQPFFMVQTNVAEIIDYGLEYGSICLCLSIGMLCQFCFERLLQATGRTSLAMATQLLGALVNILLDPILIFGLLGMPRMEVAGAAIATVTGQLIAAVVAMILNLKLNREIHICAKMIRWNKDIAKEIYRVALPSIIMQSIGSVMTFGFNKILITFSTTATAVFGAYYKLQSFVFMPVFGLNNGMVPIIAYNYGAAKADRVQKTIKLTICTAVCIMGIGSLMFELFPHVLLSFFDASEYMLEIGVPALRTIGSHFLLAGFGIIAVSVCQSIGSPKYSLISAICRQLLVLLPVAWLLSQTGRLGLVWLAFPIAEFVALILSSIFLSKTMNNANKFMSVKKQI